MINIQTIAANHLNETISFVEKFRISFAFRKELRISVLNKCSYLLDIVNRNHESLTLRDDLHFFAAELICMAHDDPGNFQYIFGTMSSSSEIAWPAITDTQLCTIYELVLDAALPTLPVQDDLQPHRHRLMII